MIQAAELRIGNWIQFHDEGLKVTRSWQVTMKDFFHAVSAGIDFEVFGFEGIPITEEWLLNFGFVPLRDGLFEKPTEHVIGISLVSGGTSRCQLYIGRIPNYKFTATHIDYVHQLQNLYFALTGQELNFSL